MDLWGRCGVLVITEGSGQDNREMETMCQDIHLLLTNRGSVEYHNCIVYDVLSESMFPSSKL